MLFFTQHLLLLILRINYLYHNLHFKLRIYLLACVCRCNANFYGRTCSQGVGVCQIANPCLNGGTCTNSLSGASCSCLQSK